ncbi:THUMP domain-containing protein 1 homolog [Eumeta japonica]|uniref:THUMP domain-containing protein 1 homolog n=1 Tax=Eumeta variegata TaxID=151549 RepID=A0A4C1TS42_EUMVA|nr:THUMP domain-containing protein 1 homolog [Eumeta japonica]
MSEPPVKKQKYQSKKKYFQPKRKQYLEVGHRGFLATCNFNEKDCIRECYHILNQYADELYGTENITNNLEVNENDEPLQLKTEDTSNDISEELQIQINATQLIQNTKDAFKLWTQELQIAFY